MRKPLILILVAGIALVAGFFYFLKDPKNIPVGNTNAGTASTTPTGTSPVSIAPLLTENASSTYAEMSLSYPKSDAAHLPEIFKLVQDVKSDFWGQYGNLTAAQAQAMFIRADNQYQLFINTRIATSTNTVTYIIQVYEFLGGAHGGTSVSTFTYDKSQKLVKIDDVFAPNYLSVIAPMAKKYFYDTMGDYLQPQAVDSGTAPNTDNYSAWYLTDSDVVFIFGQYQVGPYVLGIQEYPIEKTKIADILKPAFK